MFRSIFSKTLFDHRKSALFWSLGTCGMVFMYASLYPSIAQSNELVDSLKNLPEAFKSIFGELELFATPEGFIGGEFFTLTYPLLLGILGIVLGSGLLTKEEESHTLELLLARPVSRASILRQKTAAMLLVITAIGLASWVGVALGTFVVDKFELNLWYALQTAMSGILMGWSFALLTLMVTSLASQRGLASGVAAMVFAGGFIVSTFAKRVEWLEPVRLVSLFELYSPVETLRHGWHLRDALILLAFCAACYVIAEIAFRRRDTGR